MLQVIPTGFYVSWIVWHTPHILRIMTPLYFWILLFQVSRFPESRNLQVAMIFTKQLHQLIRTPLLSTIYSNSLRRLQSLRFILTIYLVWIYKLLVFFISTLLSYIIYHLTPELMTGLVPYKSRVMMINWLFAISRHYT